MRTVTKAGFMAGKGPRKPAVAIRLYRGIAVPAELASQAIKEILDIGLLPGRWTMIATDLKPRGPRRRTLRRGL